MIGYVALVILASIIASYLYFHFKTGVPTFPTMPPMRRKMIEILQQDMQIRNLGIYTIVDFGSGSGQLSRHIALAMPQARIVGLELSPIPWLRSVIRQKLLGPSNLAYKRVDFWTYDLAHADAVVMYLVESIMEQVSEKLRRELLPGALVISSKFRLREPWKPYKSYDVGLPYPMTVRLYRQLADAANRNEEKNAPSEETELAPPALAGAAE